MYTYFDHKYDAGRLFVFVIWQWAATPATGNVLLASALLRLAHCCCVSAQSHPERDPMGPFLYSFWECKVLRVRQSMSN